jgi:lipooligosaccharide transport system permease protein
MTLRCCMTSVAFTVVTALFGLVQSPGGAVLAMVAGVLLGVAFAAPVAAYSATQQRETGFILLYRFGVVPMFLFSGTFFPISQLPPLLQPVAWVTPLWHGVSLCRGLALGEGSAWALLGHTAYLAAMALAGVLWARRTFARRLQW